MTIRSVDDYGNVTVYDDSYNVISYTASDGSQDVASPAYVDPNAGYLDQLKQALLGAASAAVNRSVAPKPQPVVYNTTGTVTQAGFGLGLLALVLGVGFVAKLMASKG